MSGDAARAGPHHRAMFHFHDETRPPPRLRDDCADRDPTVLVVGSSSRGRLGNLRRPRGVRSRADPGGSRAGSRRARVFPLRRGHRLPDRSRSPDLARHYSMFLHGSWMHLIGNMWFLWLILCNNVEDRWVLRAHCGSVYLPLRYRGRPCPGRRQPPPPASPMVGASGAIAG